MNHTYSQTDYDHGGRYLSAIKFIHIYSESVAYVCSCKNWRFIHNGIYIFMVIYEYGTKIVCSLRVKSCTIVYLKVLELTVLVINNMISEY